MGRFGGGARIAQLGYARDKLEVWASEFVLTVKERQHSPLLAEALVVGGSKEHFWLSSGLNFYILIVVSFIVSEYYHGQQDRIKVCLSPETPIILNSVHENTLLSLTGGVLYIISGSATLSFYIPLVSSLDLTLD